MEWVNMYMSAYTPIQTQDILSYPSLYVFAFIYIYLNFYINLRICDKCEQADEM